MIERFEYNRNAAIKYAHQWAFYRNPKYYNFDKIGGDCTNFVSQCIYYGCHIMNHTKTFGWYYYDSNNKAPAWTGVPYLYNFLTRSKYSVGPKGRQCDINEIASGDVIQLSFEDDLFGHSLFVVESKGTPNPYDILIAAHTDDSDFRALSTYKYKKARFIHIDYVLKT